MHCESTDVPRHHARPVFLARTRLDFFLPFTADALACPPVIKSSSIYWESSM